MWELTVIRPHSTRRLWNRRMSRVHLQSRAVGMPVILGLLYICHRERKLQAFQRHQNQKSWASRPVSRGDFLALCHCEWRLVHVNILIQQWAARNTCEPDVVEVLITVLTPASLGEHTHNIPSPDTFFASLRYRVHQLTRQHFGDEEIEERESRCAHLIPHSVSDEVFV